MIESVYDNLKRMINFVIKLSVPYFRRIIRFLALPYCYLFLVNWKECNIGKKQVAKDLLYIFFHLKYYPDNYSACRLWEKDRKDWEYYFGSSYDPYQRYRLQKRVQPKEYEILFEDKEVCLQLCEGVGLATPRLFGVIDPSEAYRPQIVSYFDNFGIDRVIVKPVRGSAGKGIVMAEKKNGSVIVRNGNKEFPIENFILSERSVVQEFITQNAEISTIADSSINTVRVVTLLNQKNDVIILGATMRFGVGKAFVDNWSAGGVAVGVDVETGTTLRDGYDKQGNIFYTHPDSSIQFEGFQIPEWKRVLELSRKAQTAFPYYKLLGMDIAITESGPLIIEINGFPDLVFQEQTSGPILKNYNAYLEFKKYGLLINKYQDNLYTESIV